MAFTAILKYPRVESVGFFFINQFKLLNAQKVAHSINQPAATLYMAVGE